jgi:hypothetical protein
VSLGRTLAYAFGLVAVITIGTAVYNGSLAHSPYLFGLWTVLALLGVAAYWAGRSVKRRMGSGRTG